MTNTITLVLENGAFLKTTDQEIIKFYNDKSCESCNGIVYNRTIKCIGCKKIICALCYQNRSVPNGICALSVHRITKSPKDDLTRMYTTNHHTYEPESPCPAKECKKVFKLPRLFDHIVEDHTKPQTSKESKESKKPVAQIVYPDYIDSTSDLIELTGNEKEEITAQNIMYKSLPNRMEDIESAQSGILRYRHQPSAPTEQSENASASTNLKAEYNSMSFDKFTSVIIESTIVELAGSEMEFFINLKIDYNDFQRALYDNYRNCEQAYQQLLRRVANRLGKKEDFLTEIIAAFQSIDYNYAVSKMKSEYINETTLNRSQVPTVEMQPCDTSEQSEHASTNLKAKYNSTSFSKFTSGLIDSIIYEIKPSDFNFFSSLDITFQNYEMERKNHRKSIDLHRKLLTKVAKKVENKEDFVTKIIAAFQSVKNNYLASRIKAEYINENTLYPGSSPVPTGASQPSNPSNDNAVVMSFSPLNQENQKSNTVLQDMASLNINISQNKKEIDKNIVYMFTEYFNGNMDSLLKLLEPELLMSIKMIKEYAHKGNIKYNHSEQLFNHQIIHLIKDQLKHHLDFSETITSALKKLNHRSSLELACKIERGFFDTEKKESASNKLEDIHIYRNYLFQISAEQAGFEDYLLKIDPNTATAVFNLSYGHRTRNDYERLDSNERTLITFIMLTELRKIKPRMAKNILDTFTNPQPENPVSNHPTTPAPAVRQATNEKQMTEQELSSYAIFAKGHFEEFKRFIVDYGLLSHPQSTFSLAARENQYSSTDECFSILNKIKIELQYKNTNCQLRSLLADFKESV
nr:hypothetical protein [Endozoicomonas sp.]